MWVPAGGGRRKSRLSKNSVFSLLVLFLLLEPSWSERTCSYEAASDTLQCALQTINAEHTEGTSLQSSASRARHLRVQCTEAKHESFMRKNQFGDLPYLRSLALDGCKVHKLPAAAFSELTALTDLSLRTDNVKLVLETDKDAFSGLNSLRNLNLTNNNMWTLPPGIFCGLKSLTVLNLSTNFLQDLSEFGFASDEVNSCKLPISKLDLSANSFSRMQPGVFGQLKKLRQLDLSNNNLNIIEDSALEELKSLETLNLAHNELVALPPALFSSSRHLKEIHLENNSLSNIAPGLFSGLEHMLVLNLSRNEISNEWLTDADTFASLVRLVALDLSHNQLSTLDAQLLQPLTSLQLLDLSHNRLHAVAPNAFLSQYNLHILHLSHNVLSRVDGRMLNGLSVLSSLSLGHNDLATLEDSAFLNCSSVVDLGLSNNRFSQVPSSSLRRLTNLKTLDIGENVLFGLTPDSLRGLDGLYALRLAGSGIANLSSEVFGPVPNIKVLNLAHNQLSKLEQNVFSHLKKLRLLRLDNNQLSEFNGLLAGQTKLKWLNVSANALQWFDYAFIPKSLEVLDISGNQIEDLGNYYKLDEGFRLRSLTAADNRIKKVEALGLLSSLESVLLARNRIKSVAAGAFQGKDKLRKVDLRRNQLRQLQLQDLAISVQGPSLPEFFLSGNPFICNCEMEWLQKINNANQQGSSSTAATSQAAEYPRVQDLDEVQCRVNNHHPTSVTMRTLKPITEIPPEQFVCGYQAHCFALCKCCDFFACDCRMQCPEGCNCFHDSTWSANVIQCSMKDHLDIPPLIPMDATAIYLDGNNLTGTLESQAFIGRKRVQFLYLNSSQIEAINNQTFNGLTELQVLHLEDNIIRRLEGYEFGNLTSLKQLYLQNNRLEFIDPLAFSSLVSLEELYMHTNQLATYPVWDLQLLPSITHVTLAGNPWTCRCDFVNKFQDFATSTSSNAVSVVDFSSAQCHSPEEDVHVNFSANVTCSDAMAVVLDGGDSIFSSAHAIPIAVGLIAVCIVIACTSIMVFVFRTPLRVWLHSKYGIRVLDACGKSAQDKLYDAFVSYSLKDEDFVKQIVLPQLEHEEPSYKLCLQHRDLPSNSTIGDSFPGVSHLCAKHVLVVSRTYLETEWVQIKFAMQDISKRLKPVILLVEELSSLDLAAAPEFNLLLKTGPVVRWSEAGFWNKLRFYLPDAKMRAYKRNLNSATTAFNSNTVAASVKPGDRDHQVHAFSSATSPKQPVLLNKYNGTSTVNANWQYDGILHSNNSSTSTRSTATTSGGRASSAAETNGGLVLGSGSSPRSSSHCSDGDSTSNTSQRAMHEKEGFHHNYRSNMGLVSNPLSEPMPWHQPPVVDHTYQTIDPAAGSGPMMQHQQQRLPSANQGEHIYHTLEPSLAQQQLEQQQQQSDMFREYDTLGKLDVMLPNGQFVPATLVRNKNGTVMPLVEIGTGSPVFSEGGGHRGKKPSAGPRAKKNNRRFV